MSEQNSEVERQIRPDDLMADVGVKKDTYYGDLKFLGIKAEKDAEGKAYLTEAQASQIRALREHVGRTGKRDGFSGSASPTVTDQNSGPVNSDVEAAALDQNSESVDAGAVAAESGQKNELADSGVLAMASDRNYDPIDSAALAELTGMPQNADISAMIRAAAELKVQQMIMPDLVKMQLAETMSFDDFPHDLQQKVASVREAANPKYQAAQIAHQLLRQWRHNRQGEPAA
jgi:hypothetical protein